MKSKINIKLRLSIIPLFILLALVIIPLPLYFLFNFAYFYYMPLIIVIAGFFVIIIGAWSDYGARKYLQMVFKTKSHFDESDLNYIYKQQFIMTIIVIGIGGLYILVGILISLV